MSEVYNGKQCIIVYGHEVFDDVKVDSIFKKVGQTSIYSLKITISFY